MNHIVGIIQSGDIEIDGKPLTPYESLKLRNHSPTGFSWGYGGSGPAQLALAILLKFTSKRLALQLYQDFKWRVVSQWPQTDINVEIDIKDEIRRILIAKKLKEKQYRP